MRFRRARLEHHDGDRCREQQGERQRGSTLHAPGFA
jgi:hypothetical protein